MFLYRFRLKYNPNNNYSNYIKLCAITVRLHAGMTTANLEPSVKKAWVQKCSPRFPPLPHWHVRLPKANASHSTSSKADADATKPKISASPLTVSMNSTFSTPNPNRIKKPFPNSCWLSPSSPCLPPADGSAGITGRNTSNRHKRQRPHRRRRWWKKLQPK